MGGVNSLQHYLLDLPVKILYTIFMDNYIPITREVMSEYKNSLYYYGETIYLLTNYQTLWYNKTSRELQLNLDLQQRDAVFQALGVSRTTFSKWWGRLGSDEVIRTEGYLCLMPFQVWEKYAAKIQDMPAKTRNVYTKVFMYLYFNISASSNQWGNSVENIAAVLKMDHSKTSEIIIWLETNGFIERSNYASSYGLSRNYFLPKQYWTDARLYEEEQLKTQKSLASYKKVNYN